MPPSVSGFTGAFVAAHYWLLIMLTFSVIMRPLITGCCWWITSIISHLFENKNQYNTIIETLCSVALGSTAAWHCAHHTGRVDRAVVSHAEWIVFPICSKKVQISAWVLNRVMSVSGRSVPSSSVHHSQKNFISLIILIYFCSFSNLKATGTILIYFHVLVGFNNFPQ